MNSTRTIQAFSLSLPNAPKMIELVPADLTAHGGLGIKDANEADGFLVLMLAYLDQAEHDRLELWLNDDFITSTTIAKGKEQDDTPLRIPPGLFQKALNRIKFTIRRTSGNDDSTKDLILLHRTSPPGDTPPVLNLSVSHKNIGPVEADKVAVTLSYQNMQWYDLIIVSCNGVQIRHTLQPDSTAPLPPLPQNVVIPIPRSVLEQGGDDPTFEFKFRVADYLSNPSGPPTWSNSVFVDVHLNRLTLPVAVLREIPTENNDDPAIVDLAKMKGGPLWALVHLVETLWSVGDSIYLKFTAELDGNPVASHEQTLPVTQVGTQLAWDIPNAKVVANSSVRMTYALIRNGATIATSTPAIAEVVGASTIELLPPFLVSPAVTPIDVLASAAGVTVRFEHLAARTEDRGRLWEEDALPGSPPFPLVQFNSNKRVNTLLSQAYLAARHGKTIELRWNLNRDGGRVGQSPPMTFSVLRIADGDSRLPIPNIAGETGVVLDVMKLTDDAKIFAAKWSFQTEGLPVWLKLDGIDYDGRPVSLPIKTGEPHLSADGLEIPVDVNWLRKLKDRSELTVVVRVGLDKQSTEESAVRLPLRSYSIKTFAIPTFEDFSSVGHRILPINSPVDINSMILTTIAPSTERQQIAQSNPFPGKIDGYVIVLGLTETRAKLRMDFKFSYSKVTFWYYHANLIVIAESFDSEGNFLEKIELNQRSLTQISFSKPGIKRIEFDNNLNQNRACFLDSFELTP
ncbi:hypothetical protein [Pseudomonas fluorescens]|uniref:hypothetical protein n=1 Tax=Pseudomonas fluorescens TaxID=294 RepID=UPI0007D06E3A|nr:hypothetical protein [Pseudomonas fluorescens]